jgi:hypothetical protein
VGRRVRRAKLSLLTGESCPARLEAQTVKPRIGIYLKAVPTLIRSESRSIQATVNFKARVRNPPSLQNLRTDMSKPIREEIWEVRNQYFSEPVPCSMAIGVKGLAASDWYLEIDAWAVIPN